MRPTQSLVLGRSPRVPKTSDLVALARPRLVALGLAVVVLAYVTAGPGPGASAPVALLAGSVLALCGASTMNQVIERDVDALMHRTASRPLPTRRIRPATAAAYGMALTAAGLVTLGLGVGPRVAAVTALGWLLYLAAYTPLKARSPAAIPVGALPGAVPVLMGWLAARGAVDAAGWTLFGILFLWQLPHFLAIGWMYRADYRRAGLQMLPDGPGAGSSVARRVALTAVALLPVSLVPALVGLADSRLYVAGALALGVVFVASALRMDRLRTGASARVVVRVSVLYLPALLLLLAADPALP